MSDWKSGLRRVGSLREGVRRAASFTRSFRRNLDTIQGTLKRIKGGKGKVEPEDNYLPEISGSGHSYISSKDRVPVEKCGSFVSLSSGSDSQDSPPSVRGRKPHYYLSDTEDSGISSENEAPEEQRRGDPRAHPSSIAIEREQKRKLEVLSLAQLRVSRELGALEQWLEALYLSLKDNGLRARDLRALQAFVKDMERVTMLLHGLARQLARLELRGAAEGSLLYLEKKEKVGQQLSEARRLRSSLGEKQLGLNRLVATTLGREASRQLQETVTRKMKLLVTHREIEEKKNFITVFLDE